MSRHAHASVRSPRITLGIILAGLMVAMFGVAAHASLLPLPTLTGGGALILRLDANAINGDGNANPADNTAVSTWTDLSANGNDAIQTIPGDQPTYMANQTPHGAGAVQFNGSTQFLLTPATISGPTTWFIVYNTEGTPAPSSFGSPITLRSSDHTTFDQINVPNFAGYQNISIVADGPSASTAGIDPAFDSSTHLLGFSYNGSGAGVTSNYQMSYDDQTPVTPNASGPTNVAFTESDGTIGQRGNDSAFYSGNISAILIYSGELNSTDYNAVQSYLNNEFLVAPEPASLGLLTVGGLTLLRRRRNYNAQ